MYCTAHLMPAFNIFSRFSMCILYVLYDLKLCVNYVEAGAARGKLLSRWEVVEMSITLVVKWGYDVSRSEAWVG
jgi:hypothetical protein